MRKILSVIIILCLWNAHVVPAFHVQAMEAYQDPQYIIVNFATINELNWAAPEHEWQSQIKPKVLSQISQMRNALTLHPKQVANNQKLLGWSTLLEYMNFPLDNVSDTSPYAVKTRRILEIADQENFPIFLPLNGFQWWDQLPELYNWWDPDGTHTDPRFFSRQKNPADFRARFIAGYNPENKWNVEWQSWDTPMKLNFRNWGGGGLRLAPPPNIRDHHRLTHTYRSVQRARLAIILKQLVPYLQKWEREGRTELFAGLSIGTEISLNASVTPRDEFLPYGYRSIQDFLCDDDKPTCGQKEIFSSLQIDTARRRSVNQYLVDLTRLATSFDIPKERVYTHVWSEAKAGEPRYTNYADTAFTLYSRPGMSFYGFAQDPLSLPDWHQSLTQHGSPPWGAVEYSAGTSQEAWNRGLTSLFNNTDMTAKVVVIYNWQEIERTGAIAALKKFLSSPPSTTSCEAPDPIPHTKNGSLNPQRLTWTLPGNRNTYASLSVHIKQGNKTTSDAPNIVTREVTASSLGFTVPELPRGIYSWYLEGTVCGNKKVISEPQTFVIMHIPSASPPPWWERLLDVFRLRFPTAWFL